MISGEFAMSVWSLVIVFGCMAAVIVMVGAVALCGAASLGDKQIENSRDEDWTEPLR